MSTRPERSPLAERASRVMNVEKLLLSAAHPCRPPR